MSTPLTTEQRLDNIEASQNELRTAVDSSLERKADKVKVQKCLDGKLPKSWGFALILGLLLAIGLGIAGIMNVSEGPQGPAGKDGISITGPAGPQGPAGSSADNTALVVQIDSLRKEVESLKNKPAPAPVASAIQTLESGLTTEDVLGAPGTGFKNVSAPKAQIFSLKAVKDSKHGEILMPNVAEKRGIAVRKGSTMPSFEFVGCTLPAGYKPVLHDRTDNTGRNWVVFVR